MPCHPDRVRSAPLPDGYQFGDAGRRCQRRHYYDVTRQAYVCDECGGTTVAELMNVPPWRPWHENAAEWSARYAAQRSAAAAAAADWRDGLPAESAAPILFWNTIEPD